MRTALVTGASSGIGAASASALAAEGFSVCLVARREERLRQVAAAIEQRCGPGRAICCPADVTSEAACRGALEAAMSAWGRIDVLVNNAGFALAGAIEDVALEAARRQFEVNVLAYLAWMKLVGPIMRGQGSGRIINISSVSGLVAFPGLGVYSASKFAVEALSDAARLEYRPWGVRVILIEPGSVATEIWDNSRNAASQGGADWQSSPFRALYEAGWKHAESVIATGLSAQIVARVVVKAAKARRPKARYGVPLEAKIIRALSHLPGCLRDWIVGRMAGS